MKITVEKLQFLDFEDEVKDFIIVSLESSYDRTFICFDESAHVDMSKIIPLLNKNAGEIQTLNANINKISSLLDTDNIKITACTSKYCEDVRLFTQTSRFNYSTDTFNTSVMESILNKYVRNNFYNKDRLVDYCHSGDMTNAIRVLKQSKFTTEDLKDLLNENETIKNIFDLYKLHEFLINNLTPKKANFKVVKI